MVTRRRVFLGLGASLLTGFGCSRSSNPSHEQQPAPAPAPALTTEALEEERHNAGSPALTAASVGRRQASKKWATGERFLGSGVAVTPQDMWHLGSITKSITATLVARLVESGAVSWDDSVGELLKDVAPDMQEAYRSVSFRHLLSHRAGLPKDIPLELFPQYSPDATNVRDERRSFAREALRMTPLGAKETSFSYSNNGYVVAGAMLEAKLDATWEELVSAHVFAPLNIASAGFGPPGEIGKLTQPAGHRFDGTRLVGMPVGEPRADNPYVLGPAGRVHMNLDDVLKFLTAHCDGTAFLRPDTWRTLHTPPFGGDYAFGWMTRPDGSLWHDGSNTLWYAEVLFNASRGVSAVAVTNEGRSTISGTVENVMQRALASVSE